MPANLYDLRQHVEFTHAIGVAIRNNCPIAEWRSWKYVPENVKEMVMDQLLVRRECYAEFESWKKVPEELKKSMLGELSDVDETDEKQRKYLDELFKNHFWQWKFDELWDAKRGVVAPTEED
ncbi:hypothetical protein C1H46_013973 [Malus baccata]|uniref:Uncharacterized protein n=1 Tax=Malus baccata TaxID=106549 RepID=A0A540MPT7_MALBA|nr:hypothetical protein C1H46_013973 [Malus baccata]